MKIGITGIANGGKTVFLTSLLWHLEELDFSSFSLSAKIGVNSFKSSNKGFAEKDIFPFYAYKEKLARGGKWPVKTKTGYTYHCTIRRKDWKNLNIKRLTRLRQLQFSNEQHLEFFDFPGERIADAAIAAYESYEKWSDHILHYFQIHLDYDTAILPYIKLQKSLQSNINTNEVASELILSYKRSLAALIHQFKPLISPSTFLLDQEGNVAPMLTENELADVRLSGLTKETQFVPLTQEMRKANPILTKQMARFYNEYRKKIVWPLFQKIIQSNRLVILIDIPSLLMGGVGRYNDNRLILHNLFEALEPQSHLGSLIQKLQSFLGLGLKKIAFVAVKADLVHPDDILNGKLESLLKQMMTRVKNFLPDVEVETFVCSAMHSTRASKKAYHLIGRPSRNNPDNVEMEFPVSPLPEIWPDTWSFGEYRFIEVRSDISQCLMKPPRQIGLDRVFEFLLTEYTQN